ncbi:MAG TPA: TIGR03435 family protein, partial [Bryobacteraceae bacterium]|nr:TIGR03435 family protein [Bryobacteraceae bacterium]
MKYLIACLALATACAQPPAQSPVFEVVSIKPSPPGAGSTVSSGGGPGTRDPGLWTCRGPNLANIILWAFQLNSSEYLTAPDWMLDARFDIDARVPAGATREQFSQMLQNMLIERFGLKFHRREKEVQGYELVVARNGPKFKEPSESSP